MITEEEVRNWKRQYGQVYSVNVRDEDYVFRPLTYFEFDKVRANIDSSAEFEEDVVTQGLIYPIELSDRVPPGVITALAERILEVSGFGSPKRMKAILDEKRVASATDIRTLMKAYVLAMIPAYTEEALDNYTFEQLAGKVALAEQVMKVQQASVGVDHEVQLTIIDPEEEELERKRDMQRHAASKTPGTAGFNDPIAQKLHSALG